MSLTDIVYVSYASHKMTAEELKEILEVARDKNKELNVTGMLLYRDGFFIQALEGEEKVVDDLFNDIATDERHKNVLVVYKNHVTTRTFTDWSMGFNKLEDHHLEDLDGYNGMLNANFFAEKPGRAVTLLESFRNKSYF